MKRASYLAAQAFNGEYEVNVRRNWGQPLGNRARLELSRDALHSMHAVWEFLALCANTLVFLAVGLVVEFSRHSSAVAGAEIAKAGSQSEWARKSGVHRTAINAILKGRKKVQHKLIVALGLKKIEAYTPQS